jgi:hypothetical protein
MSAQREIAKKPKEDLDQSGKNLGLLTAKCKESLFSTVLPFPFLSDG